MRTFYLFSLCLATTWVVSAQQAPGFNLNSLDRSVDPCVDFYKFSCGGWMKANPLPPDQARYGTFDQLQDHNREVLRKMLEAAEEDKPNRSPLNQKIGDYYQSSYGQKTGTIRGERKIDGRYEEQQVGATAGVRDRFGEPATASAKRVFGGRERYLEGKAAIEIAAERSRARHPGRDREAAGTESAPGR
jgi:predicted metalloendopeptidase